MGRFPASDRPKSHHAPGALNPGAFRQLSGNIFVTGEVQPRTSIYECDSGQAGPARQTHARRLGVEARESHGRLRASRGRAERVCAQHTACAGDRDHLARPVTDAAGDADT